MRDCEAQRRRIAAVANYAPSGLRTLRRSPSWRFLVAAFALRCVSLLRNQRNDTRRPHAQAIFTVGKSCIRASRACARLLDGKRTLSGRALLTFSGRIFVQENGLETAKIAA